MGDSPHCELLGPVYADVKGDQTTNRPTYFQYFYSNSVLSALTEELKGSKPGETRARALVWVAHTASHERIMKILCVPCTSCGHQNRKSGICGRCNKAVIYGL